MTEQSVGQALSFQARPSDVFVVTFPKCGTTWLQQIVYGLRTRGDMAFAEITEVVPWLELALDMGLDIQGPQRAEPRAYKTHLPWAMLPKGGKYLWVIRDPKDVVVSQFHFWEGWFFEAGAVTMTDVARQLFLDPAVPFSYWNHLLEFWPLRGRDDFLMLCFEEMKADLPAAVRRIAGFIGVPLDDELLDIVVRQSSIEFMRARETQFDDHLFRIARDAACGIPPGGGSSKVRKGAVGDNARELSAEVRAEIDRMWQERIATPLGLPDYAALRAELATE